MSEVRPCEHEALPDEWAIRHGELVHAYRDARAELDAAHQHLAEGAAMMEALLADREALADEVEVLNDQLDAELRNCATHHIDVDAIGGGQE